MFYVQLDRNLTRVNIRAFHFTEKLGIDEVAKLLITSRHTL